MATSFQQTLANQQNAQHSTGPRTEEGKKTVSLNALRHGLTGQLVVLPNEDRARYDRLSESLAKDLKPQGTLELMLVQTICDTEWRLERARSTEANTLAKGHLEPQPNYIADLEIPDVQTAMVEATAWERHEKVLRNIHIQEARLNRTLHKAIAELHQLQDRRAKAAADDLADAVAAATYHKQNRLTFTPSDHGFVFTIAEIKQAALREEWRRSPK